MFSRRPAPCSKDQFCSTFEEQWAPFFRFKPMVEREEEANLDTSGGHGAHYWRSSISQVVLQLSSWLILDLEIAKHVRDVSIIGNAVWTIYWFPYFFFCLVDTLQKEKPRHEAQNNLARALSLGFQHKLPVDMMWYHV